MPCQLVAHPRAYRGRTASVLAPPVVPRLRPLLSRPSCINQSKQRRQGNANPVLYKIAATAGQSCNSSTRPLPAPHVHLTMSLRETSQSRVRQIRRIAAVRRRALMRSSEHGLSDNSSMDVGNRVRLGDRAGLRKRYQPGHSMAASRWHFP